MSQSPVSARLQVEKLSFMRNEQTIFADISFQLSQSECLQIDGANGSGKSTLLRILAGLLRPSAGEIHWQGQAAFDDNSDFSQQLTYVGHKNAIKEELTPTENLEYIIMLKQSLPGISIEQALDAFHLKHCADVPVGRLSAGQKRKVSLARLALLNTDVWILDEPFTALDASGKQVLGNMINDHLANKGMVVFATHETIEINDCNMQRYHLN